MGPQRRRLVPVPARRPPARHLLLPAGPSTCTANSETAPDRPTPGTASATPNHHLGNYREATACYGRALDLFRDLGDRYFVADTLSHLARTQWAAGDPDAARASWQRALDILDRLGHAAAESVRAVLKELDG